MRKPLQWHIDEMMDHFDFYKAQQVMQTLEWKWAGIEGVPLVHHLRKKIRYLMQVTYERALAEKVPYYFITTAGFKVEYDVIDDNFHVAFIATDWDSNPGGAA